MPIRRSTRRRRGGVKLPYGVRQMAVSAARLAAFERKSAAITDAAAYFGKDNLASRNLGTRRELAITKGQGMYTGSGAYGIRRTLGQFAKRNRIGQTAYDMAMSNLTGGAGLYIGKKGIMGGHGEYSPETNGLISSKSTMDVVPLFADDSDQGIVLSKREYVSEIYGPPLVNGVAQPFVLQEFSINPGLEKTFPWLSQIAANFDEYEMQQLIFTFKSTTTESGNQTNGQVGTVIMTTNYNSAAPSFTEKFTMMQYDKSCSGRLTESLQHGVECDPALLSGSRGEYVRVNPVVSNQDLKTYDHGKFQIAIANCVQNLSDQSLGELWVTYTVVLRKPKFFTGKGLAISKDIFLSYPTNTETFSSIMGTSPLKGQQNNIGAKLENYLINGVVQGNCQVITFPAAFSGTLRVMVAVDASALGSLGPNPFQVLTGNIELVNDLYGPGEIAGDSPQSQVYSKQAATSPQSTPATVGYVAECHIRVSIATNGQNNSLLFFIPYQVGSNFSQVYVEIGEYNSGFSYSANNISKSDAPIWITNAGNIVVP